MLLWLSRTTIFGRFATGETKPIIIYAVMAQSVEHHLGKVEVPGSNPGNSSNANALLTTKGAFSCRFCGNYRLYAAFVVKCADF